MNVTLALMPPRGHQISGARVMNAAKAQCDGPLRGHPNGLGVGMTRWCRTLLQGSKLIGSGKGAATECDVVAIPCGAVTQSRTSKESP